MISPCNIGRLHPLEIMRRRIQSTTCEC